MAEMPVVFLVDDEALKAIHPGTNGSVAEASLAEAVRAQLSPNHREGCFGEIFAAGLKWKVAEEDRPPPFLPLLAVCVLAASRMGAGNLHPANYRVPFCGLLGLPDDAIPRGYEQAVPTLWRWLIWWLDDHHAGARGWSTIVEDPWLTNIGYSISQTLFRTSDRARIAEFFRYIELVPGEAVDGAELLAYFRSWAPSQGLSAGAARMLAEAEYSPVLEAMLAAHACRWDGTQVPGSDRREAGLQVVVRAFPTLRLGLIAQRPQGFPAMLKVESAGGESLQLESRAEGWYDSVPLPVDAALLMTGAKLSGDRFSVCLNGASIHLLRLSEFAGGWCSVPSIVPGERHWLLVADAVLSRVQQALADASGGDVKEDSRFTQLLPGWHLLREVVMDAPPERLSADLHVLRPSVRHRASLRGGLPLRASSTYLCGGEPDLWLPSGDQIGNAQPQIGDGDGWRPLPNDQPHVRLVDLDPPLKPGEHAIELPNAIRRTFRTLPSARLHPPDASPIAHRLHIVDDSARAYHPPAAASGTEDSDITISGAVVRGLAAPDMGPQPVLVRREIRYAMLLGARPGERKGIDPPGRAPRWMSDIGLDGRFGDVVADFEVVWVIETCRREPFRRVRCVARLPLGQPLADADAVVAWAEELTVEAHIAPTDRALWGAYADRARELER